MIEVFHTLHNDDLHWTSHFRASANDLDVVFQVVKIFQINSNVENGRKRNI